MNPRKPDRRVLRTRRQLQDALMSLILEKGYDAVTIEDITDRADLGRTTFYLHYKDKDDLLMQSLEAVYDDLVDQIQQRTIDEWMAQGHGPWTLAFQHAAENAHFYRIVLSGQGGGGIKKRVQNYIAQTAQVTIAARAQEVGVTPSVPIEVLSHYIASSLLGLIAWWLEEERPFSVTQMDEYFRQLTMQGTAQVMGITPQMVS
jgi:AcrR family transcriptional regulator